MKLNLIEEEKSEKNLINLKNTSLSSNINYTYEKDQKILRTYLYVTDLLNSSVYFYSVFIFNHL